MTLDLFVKISKIATPFIILIVGFWLNRSMQKHSLNMKLTSDFNTRWSEEFISKCKEFNEKITELQFLIFHMHDAQTKKNSELFKKYTQQYNDLLPSITIAKYKIETHSTLIDSSVKVIDTVSKIFERSTRNVDAVKSGGNVDFESIKELQNELNKYLKEMQKSILKL